MRQNLITWFNNISIKNKMYYITGVMLLLIAVELITLYSMLYLLSATMAYVGGEGLWSKAQKDATFYLLKYVYSHNENDYQKFLGFTGVNLGDRKARQALQQSLPDYKAAYEGLLEGRNQPEDIPSMMTLFVRFQHVDYLAKAIAIWTEGDADISKLLQMGHNIHQQISNGNTFSQEQETNIINQIYQLNSQMTVLEDDFSYTLGKASRWLENIVLRIVFTIAITVEVSGLLLTIFITTNIRKGIYEIIRVAKKIRMLDFSDRAICYSNDEIGQLANAFNIMIDDLEKSIEQQKKEMLEREEAQRRVASLSRLTGMADVASSVLHNVGNTLNSLKTSVMMIREKISRSKMSNLKEIANLLQQHKEDLRSFLETDTQGQHIPEFLLILSEEWNKEKKYLEDEMNLLKKNVSHIEDIIRMQQSLSHPMGIMEETELTQLIEDSLALNRILYEKAQIQVIRNFQSIKKVYTDKIKLFQILVNLIRNSIDALIECNKIHKQLTLNIKEKDDSHFLIQVSDNGIGISPHNITRIFSHGFTTKKKGHGFGLHTSALYARELGGKLIAESEGLNHGATFTLILPYQANLKSERNNEP